MGADNTFGETNFNPDRQSSDSPTSKEQLATPDVSNRREQLIAFRYWTCNTDIRNFGNDYEAIVDEYLKSN